MHFGVIIALRLGAYQLLFLDRIPAHAAVNDSVELAKQADGVQMAGLTNAVLRRIMRERATLQGVRSDAAAAYPRWLVQRWRTRFGEAEAKQICAFGQEPPPATFRISPGSETEAIDQTMEPGAFLTGARRLRKGVPGPEPSRGTGNLVRMQDEASQLVAELAALHAGPTILDCCAAPGGKTAILAERNPDSVLTAMDVSAARLRIMQRRLPWSSNLRFVSDDATTLAPGATWDTILCDVPCSGTGTLARNPEIRSRLDEASLARQAERQRAILASGLRALRPGGRLVYSTCSLEAEENEQVVEAVLAAHPAATLEPIAPALDALLAGGILTEPGHARLLATALAGPYLRTVPGFHPCDGFFAALLTIK